MRHLLFITLLPPALSRFVLPFLRVHSTWLLKCNVRRSHREWDRQPKRVKKTVQAFSNPFLEHYSHLCISMGLYEQQNWEYQEKWTQHIHALHFLQGRKAKWKARLRAMLWQEMQKVPIALGRSEIFQAGFSNYRLLKLPLTGPEVLKLFDTQRTLLTEIVVVY